ncbi:MAG TPA: response regulator [Actinomycetota bacterium]|nr:response regulator [Actinomycetota bacterium]
MREVSEVLDHVVAGSFLLLGILGARLWYERRTRQSLWLCLTFAVLSSLSLLLLGGPDDIDEGPLATYAKVQISVLLLFPYLLFRFSTSLEASSRVTEVFAGSLAAAAVVSPFFLTEMPADDAPWPATWIAFLCVVLSYWTVVSLITARRLWSGGRELPEVARRRARLLSGATVILSVVIISNGFSSSQPDWLDAATSLMTVGAAVAFYFGFAPPRFILSIWRRPVQDSFYGAVAALVRAETEREIALSVLPHATGLLGARAVAVLDQNGTILDAHEVTLEMLDKASPQLERGADQDTDEGVVVVPLRFGSVIVWTNGYAPFFGDEELEIVRTLGELAHAALERAKATRSRIEEKERLEAQIAQAQKMEAVGHLAGGIAHDFNNLLSIILNYTTFVTESLDESDERRADLEEVKGAATRGTALIRQLLTFSRKEVIKPAVVDVEQIVSSMEKLLRRTLTASIDLGFESPGSIWKTKIDPGELEQVILNMALNARDAMDEGGKLSIALTNVLVDETMAQQNDGLVPGQYVCLRVSDAGHGMDKEVVKRLFEPFFTTKERGAGTGLGMATVYGIVKRAGGYISVYSEPDIGTTFRVYLPAALEDVVTLEPESPPPVPLAHGQTILVVEDEEAILRVTVRILSRHGYRVEGAPSGPDALEILEALDGKIDLLLTDVVMPGMSGKELAAEVQAVAPDCGVIFMSGYTDEIIAKQGILDEGEHFLQKPFSADQLLAEVARVSAGVGTAAT